MKQISRLGVAALVAIVALVILYRSGSHAPIDSVAIASERYGVPFRSQTIPVNGVQLHVVEAGPANGPVVVLLHGYPEFWWGWKDQIARLAKEGFHVVAPDQRGYNASQKPKGIEDYRLSHLTADISALIDYYGGRAFLAGHDWGGVVAWRVAILHPEKVRRFMAFNMGHPLAWKTLEEQSDKGDRVSWYATFFQLPVVPEMGTRAGNWYMLVKSLRESARDGVFSDEELEHYRYAWDRDGAMRSMINWYRAGYRYPDELDGDLTVKMPVRIVWGMKDKFVPGSLAAESAKYCASAEVVELADAGHWVLHEEPKRTSDEMLEFFSIGLQ